MKISSKVGVAVLAAGLLVTGLGVWRGRPQPAGILAISAIGGDRVIVVRGDSREGSPSAYFELVDGNRTADDTLSSRGVVWRRGTTGAAAHTDPWLRTSDAITAGDSVVVRYLGNPIGPGAESTEPARVPFIGGFRATDGAQLWDRSPRDAKDPRGEAVALASLSLLAKGDRVVAFYGRELVAEPWMSAISIDPKTGADRWRADLHGSGTFGPAWIRGDALFVLTRPTLTVLDLENGKPRASIAVSDPPCLTADAAWHTRAGALHLLSLTELTSVIVASTPEKDITMTGACAMRGGTVWIMGGTGKDAAARAWVLALDPKTGAERARIELGAIHIGSPDDEHTASATPHHVTLSGEATRFVPIIGVAKGEEPRLLMIDLDQKTIAWRSRPRAELVHASLRRVATRHVLTTSESSLVASWDGDTGRLTAATHAPRGHAPSVSDERVFVRDAANMGALDPGTLVMAWSTGKIAVDDARSEAEAIFAPAVP